MFKIYYRKDMLFQVGLYIGKTIHHICLSNYSYEGEIEAETKEQAFSRCQERLLIRSMSVGDLVEDPDGIYWLVLPCGWQQVTIIK